MGDKKTGTLIVAVMVATVLLSTLGFVAIFGKSGFNPFGPDMVYGVNLSNEDYTQLEFFNDPNTRTLLKEAGITSVRVWSSKYQTNTDILQVHNIITSAGFEPIYVTSDTVNPDGTISPRAINLVTQLKDVGEIKIMVGNEPNYGGQYSSPEGYGQAFKTVQDVLSTIKTDIYYITAGIGVWKVGGFGEYHNLDEAVDYMNAPKEAGAHLDAVSFHYYCTNQETYDPSETKAVVLQRTEYLKEIVSTIKQGTGLPVYCTEFSFGSWMLDPQVWGNDYAFLNTFFEKAFEGLSECEAHYYWYAQLPLNNLNSSEGVLVMLDNGGQPKAVYDAYKNNVR